MSRRYEWKVEVKGGPGSGNWGHAGLAGMWGGSLPHGSWNIIGGDVRGFEEENGISEGDLKKMFSLRDYDAYVQADWGTIRVAWKDRDGNFVGRATRRFNPDADYEGRKIKEVHNSLLEVSDDFQDRGLARSLYQREIRILKERGWDAITLYANISIGKYAWARQGFDYDKRNHPYYPGDIYQKAVSWLEKRGYDSVSAANMVPLFENASQVASWDIGRMFESGGGWGSPYPSNVPPGMKMHAGKAFMLDMDPNGHGSWEGILWLNE